MKNKLISTLTVVLLLLTLLLCVFGDKKEHYLAQCDQAYNKCLTTYKLNVCANERTVCENKGKTGKTSEKGGSSKL